MIWANFLHIYQPPDQKKRILEKVTNESYRRIIAELKKAPKAKLTLNINACLTELLWQNGFRDVVDDLRGLGAAGQIEFTESAKYHPFLPNLPKEEIIRQIELNHETNERYLGKEAYHPKGFFPPEMAFTKGIAEIVRGLGYQWILADEASYPGENPSYSKIFTIKDMDDFMIFFRERETSFKILSAQLGSGPILLADLGERLHANEYLLTAMDGETFGHHRVGLEKLLFDIYQSSDLPTVTISEIANYGFEKEVCEPIPASWALMHKDMARHVPFSRWDDPNNAIHQLQWELTYLAVKEVRQANPKSKNYENARRMLDMALHSDQYWWASAKPWWSLEILEKGAKEFLEVVLELRGEKAKESKQAQELYRQIVFTALDWQRNGVVEDLVREHYDEEVTMRLDTTAPYVPPEEFDKIIEHLRSQMLETAKAEEYEKAAQFRDRIKELKAKRDEATKRV